MTTYVLDKSFLVLECITLAQVIQLVVEMLVDLAAGAVSDEQTTQNPETTHPQHLAANESQHHGTGGLQNRKFRDSKISVPWHASIFGTLSLAETSVSADPPSRIQSSCPGTRVHSDGFADDEAIGDKLADRLPGVGVGYLVHLVGIKPDLALSTADN